MNNHIITTRGDCSWDEDISADTVTVSSVSGKFTTYTVGRPKIRLEFSCGHVCYTGADDPKTGANIMAKIDANEHLSGEESLYHCIKCQKSVKIIKRGI